MNITKWYTEAEIKGSIAKFLAKYDGKTLDGTTDFELFFLCMIDAIIGSKESDDEDKRDLWENLETDIEELGTLAYFIELRGTQKKVVFTLKEDTIKIGAYEGKYDPTYNIGCKNKIFMEWTPKTQLKLMNGNPNTDAEFFSGELTVEGPLKLATKPRQWIYDTFTYIDREID